MTDKSNLQTYRQQEQEDQQQPTTTNISNGTLTAIPTTTEKTASVEDEHEKTSHKRLFLRIFQMLCVIGSFGFQASANTVKILFILLPSTIEAPSLTMIFLL